MTPVAIRSVYGDFYGTAALPVLEEVFRAELDMHPSRREMLAKVVAHDRDIYQSSEIHDMDLWSEVAEGAEYSFKRGKQGASKTLTIKKMGLGLTISEEAIADGKIDMVGEMLKKLARSGKESQEVDFFNLFNNGFNSETTADGVAIFSASHTLPSGGTFRNILSTAADLSASSLDTALSDFETQFVGDTGIVYNIKPKFLLVHSSNKRYAMELVGSELKPDSADNNMNALKNEGLVVVSSPHMTDTDSWHLLGAPGETGLRIISRAPIETKSWIDETTDSIAYRSRYREKVGCLHAYGVFGSAGA